MSDILNSITQPNTLTTDKDYWRKAYRGFLALFILVLLFGIFIIRMVLISDGPEGISSSDSEVYLLFGGAFFGLNAIALGTLSVLFKKHIQYAPTVVYGLLPLFFVESLLTMGINIGVSIVLLLIFIYLAYISYKASKSLGVATAIEWNKVVSYSKLLVVIPISVVFVVISFSSPTFFIEILKISFFLLGLYAWPLMFISISVWKLMRNKFVNWGVSLKNKNIILAKLFPAMLYYLFFWVPFLIFLIMIGMSDENLELGAFAVAIGYFSYFLLAPPFLTLLPISLLKEIFSVEGEANKNHFIYGFITWLISWCATVYTLRLFIPSQ